MKNYASLRELPRLRKLSLEGDEETHSLNGLTALRELRITGDGMAGLLDADIEGLTALRVLDLSTRNNDFSAAAIVGMTLLEKLRVENEDRLLPALPAFLNLTTFSVNGDGAAVVDVAVLALLPNLTALEVIDRAVLAEQIGTLTRLRRLELRSTPIHANDLAALSNLTALGFDGEKPLSYKKRDHGRVQVILETALWRALGGLVYLKLGAARLQNPDFLFISNSTLRALEILDVRERRDIENNHIAALPRLRALFMEYTAYITAAALRGLRHLEYVDCPSSRLTRKDVIALRARAASGATTIAPSRRWTCRPPSLRWPSSSTVNLLLSLCSRRARRNSAGTAPHRRAPRETAPCRIARRAPPRTVRTSTNRRTPSGSSRSGRTRRSPFPRRPPRRAQFPPSSAWPRRRGARCSAAVYGPGSLGRNGTRIDGMTCATARSRRSNRATGNGDGQYSGAEPSTAVPEARGARASSILGARARCSLDYPSRPSNRTPPQAHRPLSDAALRRQRGA